MQIMVQLMNGPRSENPDTIGEYGPYASFQEAVAQHNEDNDDVARVIAIYDASLTSVKGHWYNG